MSFDVFLFRFAPRPEGFDAHKATNELWEKVRNAIPSTVESRLVETENGAEIEVQTPTSEGHVSAEGGAFFLRALTPALIDVLYRITSAGQLVVAPAMHEAKFVITAEGQQANLPDDERWLPPILIESSEELRAYLRGGYQEWVAYRDQVITRQSESPPPV